MFVIELLDKYATAFPLLTIALLETLVVSWLYGMYISLHLVLLGSSSLRTSKKMSTTENLLHWQQRGKKLLLQWLLFLQPTDFVGVFASTVIIVLPGYKRLKEDIRIMLGRPPNPYWVACWTVISPVLVLVGIWKQNLNFKNRLEVAFSKANSCCWLINSEESHYSFDWSHLF